MQVIISLQMALECSFPPGALLECPVGSSTWGLGNPLCLLSVYEERESPLEPLQND